MERETWRERGRGEKRGFSVFVFLFFVFEELATVLEEPPCLALFSLLCATVPSWRVATTEERAHTHALNTHRVREMMDKTEK